MKAKTTEQPTYPFLFAARTFAADTHSEKLVLYHLISRMRDGTCYPKQDAIAYAELITKRAVQYGIFALKKKGVITIEKSGRNNIYRLHLDAIKKYQLPPMPDTEEPTEPPTAKNVLIGGRRVGKTNPSSPIDTEEHTNHISPVSGIGEISDKNTRSQSTCKKTWQEDIKSKEDILETNGENFSSGNQEPVPQAADAVPQVAPTGTRDAAVLILQTKCQANGDSPIQKPRIALHEAKRQVEQHGGWSDLVCTKCWRVGAFDAAMGEGCQSYGDDGVSCGGAGIPTDQWLAQLETQWEAYNKQVAASAGVPLKDIIGPLHVPSMERQKEIISCRSVAETKTFAERRTWAKELFDTGNRWKVRKAWYMYASGMLDDDGGEAEPWVTQLFSDLESLQPRDGETK
jgi:hypothetical protein